MVEITNEDELKAWLDSMGRDVAVAIATRCALRVLPLLADFMQGRPQDWAVDHVLPTFHRVDVAWVRSAWPNRSVGKIVDSIPFIVNFSDVKVSVNLAAPIVDSALYAVRTITSPSIGDAAAIGALAANCAVLATNQAPVYSGNDEAPIYTGIENTPFYSTGAMWAEIKADADALDGGLRTSLLTRRPLWPNFPPRWLNSKWGTLKSTLLALNEDWQVWTDWYYERLCGADHLDSRPLVEELERERILIPDEEWQQGPKHVNAMIAELEAEYRAETPPLRLDITEDLKVTSDASVRINPKRLNLVAGERPTILSNPNGIARELVQEHLDVTAATLEELKETLDGYVGQNTVQEGDANTNKIVLPMAEGDLAILRHYVEAGIQEAKAPRLTQMSVDLFDYDRMLFSQSKSFMETVNDTAEKYKPLIYALSAAIASLGVLVSAFTRGVV